MAAFPDSCDKLRLPDKFAKLLDGRELREVTLREAGGARRRWDVEVVLDGDGHMYLERGWEEFARDRDMVPGNVVLAVKVFDDANTGSSNSIDTVSNGSSSAEIDFDDEPRSQSTITLKKFHLGVRKQQQYLNVPPEFRNAHGCEERGKVLPRMPGKSWPVNLEGSMLLITIAKLLDGRELHEVTLREAAAGRARRLWGVEVVFDGDGHMYIKGDLEQFPRAHDLGLGHVLVFSYDGGAVLAVKVFDDANTGSGSSNDNVSNGSSSAEIDIDDEPRSQSTITLKKCHLAVRKQQYPNVPRAFQNAHGCEERSKVLPPRVPAGKPWPVNLNRSLLHLVTIAVLLCTIAAPSTASTRPWIDGWEQIPDINATEVQEMARWAVAEHARQADDGLQYKRAVSGMEQVVSGTNWKLRIAAANGDGVECVYVAEVYDQPWTHTRTLELFSPAQSTQGSMCTLPPPTNSSGPRIRPSLLILGLLTTSTSWALFLVGSLSFLRLFILSKTGFVGARVLGSVTSYALPALGILARCGRECR